MRDLLWLVLVVVQLEHGVPLRSQVVLGRLKFLLLVGTLITVFVGAQISARSVVSLNHLLFLLSGLCFLSRLVVGGSGRGRG